MDPVCATASHARMFIALAEVELARLAPLLPAPLRPCRMYGETGALSVQFLDIFESNVGAYCECTVSVLCEEIRDWPDAEPDARVWPAGFPIWIVATNALAQLGGRDLWAYPKHCGAVSFEVDGLRFRGEAAFDGQRVECSATLGSELDSEALELRSLSRRAGDLLLTRMPGRAALLTDWDPQAPFTIDIPTVSLGSVSGIASMGLYAKDYTFEWLAPQARALEHIRPRRSRRA